MTNNDRKKIQKIGFRLENECRLELFISKKWKDNVPNKPGVYAIWTRRKNNSVPVYIGESSNLSERFSDIGSWRNHSFSRNIKKKYNLSSPEQVRAKISKLYNISYVPLSLGRKEVEEYLITEWATYKAPLFNKIPSRYLRSQ